MMTKFVELYQNDIKLPDLTKIEEELRKVIKKEEN